MRLGLIARCDNRGLGQQSWEAFRHLKPHKTLVVNCPSAKPLPLHPERFPGATIVDRIPSNEDCKRFLADLDVCLTFETPYNHDLFLIADQMGVKTVLQYNHEFLAHLQHPNWPKPTLFAAPSMWRFDEVPFDNKTYLPVPVALDRFPVRELPEFAHRFLHLIGRPAVHDRNGTLDLLFALQYVRSEITVTVKCQEPGYVNNLIRQHKIHTPDNVTLVIHPGDVENYWDNYQDDVLVMPRRFGGLCLPVHEALAAGMPVIMPDIPPNTWLPSDWLIPAHQTGSFMAKTRIDVHAVQPRDLASKMDRFATDQYFYGTGKKRAWELGNELSWDELLPLYEKTFDELCTASR